MVRLQSPLAATFVDASPEELEARIGAAKAALGSRLFILGHHYQRDEVMRWADARGDSFGLSRLAAQQHEAEFIVFCGVHFMAESADVLTADDQQLGRNTGYQLGFTEDDMRVWNPRLDLGGLDEKDVKEATFLLWKGHCSVHQRFRPEHVEAFRAEHPQGIVIAHPECSHEVCDIVDKVGSTDFIIREVNAA